jgi:DNA-binding transcriptional LysR family regulator
MRLGFHLSRTGRTFRITDNVGAPAINSTPAMTLEALGLWHLLPAIIGTFRRGYPRVEVEIETSMTIEMREHVG